MTQSDVYFVNKEEILTVLSRIGKTTQFGGPGRFTWQGSQLIKYTIVVNEISLFYQVRIADYKLVSHYWFSYSNHLHLSKDLEDKGVKETTFEYDETNENIALEITWQIEIIISIFDEKTSDRPNR